MQARVQAPPCRSAGRKYLASTRRPRPATSGIRFQDVVLQSAYLTYSARTRFASGDLRQGVSLLRGPRQQQMLQKLRVKQGSEAMVTAIDGLRRWALSPVSCSCPLLLCRLLCCWCHYCIYEFLKFVSSLKCLVRESIVEEEGLGFVSARVSLKSGLDYP